MITQRNLKKLEDIYKEARGHCDAYYMPHTFDTGNQIIRTCWQGRINRAQVMIQPDDPKMVAAYDALCRLAERYRANAEKSEKWYADACKELGQTPKPLREDCPCFYCTPVWAKEIAFGDAVHDFVTSLVNGKKGDFDKVTQALQEYRESCELHGIAPEPYAAAYGWQSRHILPLDNR